MSCVLLRTLVLVSHFHFYSRKSYIMFWAYISSVEIECFLLFHYFMFQLDL